MSDLSGTSVLSLKYIPLGQAVEWDWMDNPKLHDIGGIVQSIKEHGFRDPPEYDATLEGFAQGNGRVKALHWMFDQGHDRPAYVEQNGDGQWAVPVLFGADSQSKAAAQAYAIDANNLVLTGGDTELWDILALYDKQQLAEITEALIDADQSLVTLDPQSMDFARGDEPDPEEASENFRSWRFEVHFEDTEAMLLELENLIGPYFMPRSKRKLMPEFFLAMVRAYCESGLPVVVTE